MPYLDRNWPIGTQELQKGEWVPERNWDRWKQRAADIPPADGPLPWRTNRNLSTAPVSTTLSDPSLTVLAGDIVSAQRDALVYGNLIERLKNSPSDATADEVVDHMRTLGFLSADWPEPVGGPPPHDSPRPFRRVLDWLLRLAAKVARFLLTCVECAMSSLALVGVSAVAVGISWSPEVSFEFSTGIDTAKDEWKKARKFLEDMLEHKVFSV